MVQDGRTQVFANNETSNSDGLLGELEQINFWTFLVAINISNKERGGTLERMPSLDEPSPSVTTCFKIEATYIHCNTTNALCL